MEEYHPQEKTPGRPRERAAKVPAYDAAMVAAYDEFYRREAQAYMQEARLSIDHPSTSLARALALVTESNQPKIPFDEALKEITGSKSKSPAARLARFDCFSRYLAKRHNWSPAQITEYLASRTDHSPPIKRPSVWNRPLFSDPPWWDFGGFLAAELPSLKADYARWAPENKIVNSSRSQAGIAKARASKKSKREAKITASKEKRELTG
jgi:hypothetical protein